MITGPLEAEGEVAEANLRLLYSKIANEMTTIIVPILLLVFRLAHQR